MENEKKTILDHIAVAVSDLEKGLTLYVQLLGLDHEGTEEVPEQRVRAALLRAGATRIELVEPTGPDSPIARFIERSGEGLHHIAFQVGHIESALEKLKAHGVRLIDEAPRQGVEGSRIAFVHPSATGGVLIELVQK
jgi:methylmalonyl-CoA/ethylmalonyl-CoA epimerase